MLLLTKLHVFLLLLLPISLSPLLLLILLLVFVYSSLPACCLLLMCCFATSQLAQDNVVILRDVTSIHCAWPYLLIQWCIIKKKNFHVLYFLSNHYFKKRVFSASWNYLIYGKANYYFVCLCCNEIIRLVIFLNLLEL